MNQQIIAPFVGLPACCCGTRSPAWRSAAAGLATLGAIAILFVARSPRDEDLATESASSREPAAILSADIAALLHAESAGDLNAYRASVTGPLRDQIEARLKQESPSSVAESLRQGLENLKGQATTDTRLDGSDSATITLELIFADHHELRRLELRRAGERWKISTSQTVRSFVPPVRYGTPVGG
ncbi:MAG: hypothetical protein HZA46_12480 [Planctomycetales bacterium]|nr:hypothetical protein [Planctomycetales bacterium]